MRLNVTHVSGTGKRADVPGYEVGGKTGTAVRHLKVDVARESQEAAKIVCTDECAARGQCGVLPDDHRAVLANEGRPAVWDHNRFFVDGTPVIVREVSNRELIASRDRVPLTVEATPFPHIFYRVEGEGKNAWVSEWCIARP